ncbi:hypothetical protein [Curtobacterium sp. SORGH_AS_0776]|uniref:hypothetical protein n=1 Tax=Curtobacterium sp. SORGH_AS_0776 TaxID=3041798 RepID=UPI00285D9778|nr:hypothetical protein [Curtobacterium sp. SORGH_AS_0776]MDR6171110.1 hypothetical protein [Curtobacterium sp. SORGH_AS_0776]
MRNSNSPGADVENRQMLEAMSAKAAAWANSIQRCCAPMYQYFSRSVGGAGRYCGSPV